MSSIYDSSKDSMGDQLRINTMIMNRNKEFHRIINSIRIKIVD